MTSPLPPPIEAPLAAQARALCRGLRRHLALAGVASLTEMPLPIGRRVDLMLLGPKGELGIVEVKSGPADFRADQKWPEYLEFADRFWFAVASDFPRAMLPEAEGLWIADGFGAVEMRPARLRPLAPARRKALTLGFARLAAARLQGLEDPEAERSLLWD